MVTVRWRWESINIKFGEEKKVKSQGISIFEIKNGKIDNLMQAFEATINDYVWSKDLSRSIAVDIRYVL